MDGSPSLKRKIVVRVVKKEEPRKRKNHGKHANEHALELLAMGLKYFNFVLPINIMTEWCDGMDKKPNVRMLELIKEDMASRNAG